MTTYRMPPGEFTPNMRAWLAALRSGNYGQGKSRLVVVQRSGEQVHKSFCCLGVGCMLVPEMTLNLTEEGWFEVPSPDGPVQVRSLPSKEFLVWLGLITQEQADEHTSLHPVSGAEIPFYLIAHPGRGVELAMLNDQQNLSFAEIADLIEQDGIEATLV